MQLRHVGFIMDGNGRWAQSRGLPRTDGYAEGLLALRRVFTRARELGIEAVSVYAFSTENFSRPDKEIEAIFDVIEKFNRSYDGDARVTYMGDVSMLPDGLEESVNLIEARTERNSGTVLNIALNYGGRDDLVHAAEICYSHGVFGKEAFEKALGSSHLPPLDLIVRTGGEMRLSNFMLYESAYAELIFLTKMWPDMTAEDVDRIVEVFDGRKRKFGA